MMPDREKVIKGLEILINGCEYIHCDDCCFYIFTKQTRCGLREEQIKDDALVLLKEQEHKDRMYHALEDDWKRLKELLKEQEAVEPFSDDDGGYWCSSCHEDIVWHQKFCSNCGKPILWEGR